MNARSVPVITDADSLERLPEGTLARLELDGAAAPPLCVVRLDGELRALSDRCPHRGAPLSGGRLDGTAVTCPVHGLRFDVRTGKPVQRGGGKATPYVVTVLRDTVTVRRVGFRERLRARRKRRDHRRGGM
jgi:nitrite reductase/ring-hydroxylating ferredoxin subunit